MWLAQNPNEIISLSSDNPGCPVASGSLGALERFGRSSQPSKGTCHPSTGEIGRYVSSHEWETDPPQV